MPSVLLICEVNLGMGHLARMLVVASALTRHFRVVLLIITDEPLHVDAPAGVELSFLYRPTPPAPSRHQVIAAGLLAVATEVRPVAILIEYFPFGRHASIFAFLPFLKKVRDLCPANVQILCSIRDIQDSFLGGFEAKSVAQIANSNFDAILVHSDPRLTRLEDSFSAADQIKIPVHYTNYVSRHARLTDRPEKESKKIVISAGGGRGGEALLRCAVAAANAGLFNGYQVKILAGKLLFEQDWNDLVEASTGAGGRFVLLRWVPDLFTELRDAAVSVSRFGYNTTQDLLASGVPSLVIPFGTETENEQIERANLLAKMGVIRLLPESEMTPESLAAETLRTIDFQPASLHARLDGGERTCEIVSELVAGKQLSATV